MDNPFHQNEAGTQQADGFIAAGLGVLKDILNWLAGLIQLTEEEKKDAGIYAGDQYDR